MSNLSRNGKRVGGGIAKTLSSHPSVVCIAHLWFTDAPFQSARVELELGLCENNEFELTCEFPKLYFKSSLVTGLGTRYRSEGIHTYGVALEIMSRVEVWEPLTYLTFFPLESIDN